MKDVDWSNFIQGVIRLNGLFDLGCDISFSGDDEKEIMVKGYNYHYPSINQQEDKNHSLVAAIVEKEYYSDKIVDDDEKIRPSALVKLISDIENDNLIH